VWRQEAKEPSAAARVSPLNPGYGAVAQVDDVMQEARNDQLLRPVRP
jgi:hypothetical protein